MKKPLFATGAILLALTLTITVLSLLHDFHIRKKADPELVATDTGVWIIDAVSDPELVYAWTKELRGLRSTGLKYFISDGSNVYEITSPLNREKPVLKENPSLLPELTHSYVWKAPKSLAADYPEVLQPHRIDRSFQDYELVYLDDNGGLHALSLKQSKRTTIDANAGLSAEALAGLERYGRAFTITNKAGTTVYFPYMNASGRQVWLHWDLP